MQKQLYLSKTDQKLAGVCGGIAEYFDIDSTIIRLIWIFLAFAGGSGLLIYIIAAIVMQEKPSSHPSGVGGKRVVDVDYETVGKENSTSNKKDNDRYILGGALIVLGLYVFSRNFFFFRWLDFRYLGPGLLVIVGLYMILKGRK